VVRVKGCCQGPEAEKRGGRRKGGSRRWKLKKRGGQFVGKIGTRSKGMKRRQPFRFAEGTRKNLHVRNAKRKGGVQVCNEQKVKRRKVGG